jgi:alanine dehydrogenase
VVQLVDARKTVEACEGVYAELAKGNAATTFRRDLIFPAVPPASDRDEAYRFVTMEGGTVGLGVVAQRIDSERVGFVQEGDVRKQVEIPITPSSRFVGLIYLYSIKDGELLAIMNDGEIGRLRVAATVAVGAKYMSKDGAEVLGLFGAGWHAGAHVPAIASVRGIRKVRVFSPTPSRRREFCSAMSERTGIDVRAVDSPDQVVKGADMVAAASSSRGPVCRAESIERGTHLSCIVQYEYDEATWSRADIIVASQIGHGDFRSVGDLHRFAPTQTAKLPFDAVRGRVRMLTELLNGDFKGREDDDQITLFYKGLGLGIEFAAVAKVVYTEAVKRGMGREIPTEWFNQDSHT